MGGNKNISVAFVHKKLFIPLSSLFLQLQPFNDVRGEKLQANVALMCGSELWLGARWQKASCSFICLRVPTSVEKGFKM